MPRHARLDIPGLPRHICIRAVNGMPCFTSDLDRNVFLKYLREAMEGTDFQLHAFVLMDNHVHLLATSHVTGTVAKVMHSLCMQYARYFNHHFDRTGPLFQGRYWASLIDSQQYFFQVMRYIELNPVRAGMVVAPELFPWSSHAHNTGRQMRAEITLHDEFLRLGGSPVERCRTWVEFVSQGISQPELDRIRRRLRKCRPYGSDDFEKRYSPDKGDGSAEPSHRPVPHTGSAEPSHRPVPHTGSAEPSRKEGPTS